MKKDLILCGVGGQGILSIATIIGEAAVAAGLNLKQAEVHGMSQRGGSVESHLRLSDTTICSDLIPRGEADIIISMDSMEALRYLPYLNANGWVITSSLPFRNIPDYPEPALGEVRALPHVKMLDIEQRAKELGLTKGANVILLGMAAANLGILTATQLREAVSRIFASKGQTVVENNLKAFDAGLNAAES